MRFALFGVNDDVLPLVRSLVALPGAQIVLAAAGSAGRVNGLLPNVELFQQWESLLINNDLDAVLVAADQTQASWDDCLRKLAQEAVPLVLVHPLCDSALAYELEMIRSESGGLLLPYFPGRGHPGIARLADIVKLQERSPVGGIEEIVLERQLADRHRDAVQRWLPRDVHVIRSLVGDISSVSAIGRQKGDTRYNNLSIHFTGQSNLTARWSLAASADQHRAGRVVVYGDNGSMVLHMPHDTSQWTLEVEGNQPARHQFPDWQEAAALVEEVARGPAGTVSSPSWLEICQDLDVCETVDRSLRRKRTIDVRPDDRSEESAFKGIMAAVGCSLLLVALVILLLAAVIEGFRMPFADSSPESAGRPDALPLWIRLWPAYPLLGFLALQLLLFVAKRPRLEKTHDE